MLRRFSIAARLFGLVGLVCLFAAAGMLAVLVISWRLENLVVQHTQEIMLEGEKAKVKAAAHSMAQALGQGLSFAADDAERKALARKVVDPVRFEADHSGYFFVYQGTVNVALPTRPELVGQDLDGFKDVNGVHYVRELARAAQAGGDFVSYRFTKPGGGEEPKISFAEFIPGTDLWVGTGVYLGNVAHEEAKIAGQIEALFNKAGLASLAVFLAMLGLLSALSLAIARSVATPLAQATGAAEDIASGNLDVSLDVKGRDEAARLQAALNRMVAILKRNIAEIEARREEAEEKAHLAQMALEEAHRAGQEVVAQVAMRIESLQKIASAVAHQLRNPTMIIGGMAGLLLKKPSQTERYLEYLDGIIEAARRIENITAAVREYASIRLGTVEDVAAASLMDEAVMVGRELAGKLGKPAEWSVEADQVTLLGDPVLISMALAEMVRNAVEALPAEGGRVLLRADRDEDGVTLSVCDNGSGIAAEEMQYVQDPFYSTKPVGVGMGLTKAARVAQEHGGSLEIESEQGRGTVVGLRLPRAATLAALAAGRRS